jgi:hypothetical protein
MNTNNFIKIIATSLKEIKNINDEIRKDNLMINNLSLDICFSPDSQLKNIELANKDDLFMDKYKQKPYFKMKINISTKG